MRELEASLRRWCTPTVSSTPAGTGTSATPQRPGARSPRIGCSSSVSCLRLSPGGRALDIACGGGRNTFFLAALGFEVDALDISDVAVARVQELIAQRGAPVTVQRTDLAAGAYFPRSAYEVVIDFFFRERSLFAPTAQALAPGGLLVFETFVSARPEAPAKSFDQRFGLEPGELRRAFAALELLRYEEVQNGDESSGYRRVARLAARRPA